MKRIILIALFLLTAGNFVNAQVQTLQKLSQLSFNTSCAGVWHYVDPSGNEYALLGNGDGLVIVDVTDPVNPAILFTVPAASSLWREVAVFGHYAYAGTEGGGGITIVDLSNLPASYTSQAYTGDGAIAGTLDNSHTVKVYDGYLYIFGSNIGTVICDLSDPWNPTYVGSYTAHYVHDGYVLNDTLYSSEVYDGQFSVVDVTNKANPVVVASESTPGMFNHNGWFSDNNQYFYTTDELPNTPLGVFDVSDINDIKLVNTFYNDTMPDEEVHNVRVINDYLVNPSYGSQITIVDAARPENLIEIARYQTGSFLCWDASPYLPSGNIIVTDMDGEFYVFAPYYVRGCYLEGNITNLNTSAPINNAQVNILSTNVFKSSNVTGDYKTGYQTAGTYDVLFSAPGYIDQTITGVVLNNGVVTNLDVQLEPFAVTIEVIDNVTLLPVPNAKVKIQDANNDIELTTNTSGTVTVSTLTSGMFTITAGKWGYKSNCVNTSVSGSGTITIDITTGIYDDFTFDYGWSVSGSATSGMWVRDEPIGTMFGLTQANPDFDSNTDCSDRCFVTGNGGGTANFDDVDDGTVILTSPVFDVSAFTNPYVNYERWFFEQFSSSAAANDTMFITLSNGTVTETIEMITGPSATNSSWVANSVRILDFMSLSANMTLTVELSDKVASGNPLEGGFDRFEVTEGPTGLNSDFVEASFNVYPNPFNNQLTISTEMKSGILIISDVTGREVNSMNFENGNNIILETSQWSSGVYFIQVTNGTSSETIKAVK